MKTQQTNPALKKGLLKIFLGYAPGTGKTYAMLSAAGAAIKAGKAVCIAALDAGTHPETILLAESLPCFVQPCKGELDLNAVLQEHPDVVCIDDLARKNPDSTRHRQRYQDIEELLHAGIDVYTTLNVSQIESLQDRASSISPPLSDAWIPDSFFEQAAQVELVDIEPLELASRMKAGKLHLPKQLQPLCFDLSALDALRQMMLRAGANRLSRRSPAHAAYPSREHILACLSPSPANGKVLRAAARLAKVFDASFTALFVETKAFHSLSSEEHLQLRKNMELAQRLGATVTTVYGENIAVQIAEYAKASGVSKLVIGRSNFSRWSFFSQPSFFEKLTATAPDLDIYMIPQAFYAFPKKRAHRKFFLSDTIKTLLILCGFTLIGFGFKSLGFSEANIITVYILGVLLTAFVTHNRIYSLVSSLLSVIAFNFFFTQPQYTLSAYGTGYPVTFIIMFTAAFITGTLTMKVKEQARQAARKAYRTELLLATSQKLQRAENRAMIISEALTQILKLTGKPVLFYDICKDQLCSPRLFTEAGMNDDISIYTTPTEAEAVEWVYHNNANAGAGTNTMPGAKCFYTALCTSDQVPLAIVGIASDGHTLEAFEHNLLMAMLNEFALALEKEQSNETKNELSIKAQQEQLRSNLLRSVSHDLRTPLTSISGNAGVLLSNGQKMSQEKKEQLYLDIYDNSIWLINLVENLLSVTRIENGSMDIEMEAELVSEVISEALRHTDRQSCEHSIQVSLEDDLLMARMDSRLIVQVLMNLVNNAVKYTPSGSHIEINAKKQGQMILVQVKDDGNGIPAATKPHLFDLFFTAGGSSADSRRGFGLGLALCKSIITAHGGTISVEDNHPHGTIFQFTLQAQEVAIYE